MIQHTRDWDLIIIKAGTPISGKVLMWSTMYYYKGLVIDCGCANTAEETYNFVRSLGDIKAVLITHHHEDHVGCAHLFDRDGYPIYASEKSIDLLKEPPRIPEYRRTVWGQPESIDAEPIDDELDIGDIHISAYETPGHSDDHLVYLIDGMLFTGDLIGSVKPKIAFYPDNYRIIMDSVKNTVLGLDFAKAYGGHLILTREDIRVFIDYLEDLRKRVMKLRDQGYSVDEIIELLWQRVPEKVYMMEVVSEGEWHRRYLVGTLL